jgi:hypothetical protein
VAENLIDVSYNIFSSLKNLRGEYKAALHGFREERYRILQEAAGIRCSLKGKEKRQKKVLSKIKAGKETDVMKAILVYLTGAKSEAAKKRAWKYARALTFLLDEQGISVDSIAASLRESGGIEKIARKAAAVDPRTKSPRPKATSARIKLPTDLAKKILQLPGGSIVRLIGRRAEEGTDGLLQDIDLDDRGGKAADWD